MYVDKFPNACNIAVVTGLGGTNCTMRGSSLSANKAAFLSEMIKIIKEYKSQGYSCLAVSLNNEQEEEKEWLEELGFSFTAWMPKPKHCHTVVSIGYLALFTEEEITELKEKYCPITLDSMSGDGTIPV